MRRLSYGEAISEATVQCMEADPSIFVAGIGVDDFKGIFGTTRRGAPAVRRRAGLRHPQRGERHDRHRHWRGGHGQATASSCIRGTTSCSSAWISSRTSPPSGATCSANGSGVPIVLRGIVGRGWGQGATHSQSLQAMFAHFPGLYVATPAAPADAKGLLVSALQGTGPVVLLENRALYELEERGAGGARARPLRPGAW